MPTPFLDLRKEVAMQKLTFNGTELQAEEVKSLHHKEFPAVNYPLMRGENSVRVRLTRTANHYD